MFDCPGCVLALSTWDKCRPDGLWPSSRKAAGLPLLHIYGLATMQKASVFFALQKVKANLRYSSHIAKEHWFYTHYINRDERILGLCLLVLCFSQNIFGEGEDEKPDNLTQITIRTHIFHLKIRSKRDDCIPENILPDLI